MPPLYCLQCRWAKSAAYGPAVRSYGGPSIFRTLGWYVTLKAWQRPMRPTIHRVGEVTNVHQPGKTDSLRASFRIAGHIFLWFGLAMLQVGKFSLGGPFVDLVIVVYSTPNVFAPGRDGSGRSGYRPPSRGRQANIQQARCLSQGPCRRMDIQPKSPAALSRIADCAPLEEEPKGTKVSRGSGVYGAFLRRCSGLYRGAPLPARYRSSGYVGSRGQ